MDFQDDGVVIHFRDGTIEKARRVSDIAADATSILVERTDGSQADIPLTDLKAVFFLRPAAAESTSAAETLEGSTLAVEFGDGEVIRGKALQYNPGQSGFILFPTDRSKNERVFVVNSAITSIEVEKF